MATEQILAVRRLLVILGQLGEVMHTAIAEQLGEDLTGNTPVVVLFGLEESGALRPGQIQDLTGLSSGGVSKLLDRLTVAGLVQREYGVLEEDRRGSLVRLTPKGRRMTQRIAESVVNVLGDIQVMLKEIDHTINYR